jgi:hypothetical protein
MKYIHLRHQYDGLIMPTGGMTIAYDIDQDRVFYAVARCSVKDNFCRRIGRTVASGRWDKQLNDGTIKSAIVVGNPRATVLRDLGILDG